MSLATADVTTLGAGVGGLSSAYCAAQRGAPGRGIELAGIAQVSRCGGGGAVAPPKRRPASAK